MLESAARGKTMSYAADAHAKWRENFDEVVCGGLAFHIGTEGEDNLDGIFERNAICELLDPELIRTDVIEGSEASAEGVVKAVKRARAFERKNVGGVFDDADLFAPPLVNFADFAKVIDGKEATFGARANGFRRAGDSRCERSGVGVFVTEEPKGNAFCTAGADAGESAEFAGERKKGGRVVEGHGLRQSGR